MKLINLVNKYINYRRSLGEKFFTNGIELKAFCHKMGKYSDPNNISEKKVNNFLYGDKIMDFKKVKIRHFFQIKKRNS